jgi:hypothetical protein
MVTALLGILATIYSGARAAEMPGNRGAAERPMPRPWGRGIEVVRSGQETVPARSFARSGQVGSVGATRMPALVMAARRAVTSVSASLR